jgi:threonyl-tRNA synthetase
VADTFAPYLQEIVTELKSLGVRAEIDLSDDRMQKKVRNAQLEKIPFMLIAGEEDQNNRAVSFRFRDGSQKNGVSISEAIDEIMQAIKTRQQV